MLRTVLIRFALITALLAPVVYAEDVVKPNSASPALRARVIIDPRAVEQFKDRVDRYVDLHKQLHTKIGKLRDDSTPEQIADRKRKLAEALRAARHGARQGDIFTAAVREEFVRVIRFELDTPGGASIRRAIVEEKPSKVPLAVNASYPEDKPLSTMPPMVLVHLPQLPEQLEYRFVNRSLVLRDTVAGIVIDFVPGVL